MSDRFDQRQEHKLESKPEGADDACVPVRRIELITGVMPKACSAHTRRRQWSNDEKARIIVESLAPGANVSEVARRNGMSPQQLFGRRREARVLFSGSGGEAASAAQPADEAAASLVVQTKAIRSMSPDGGPAFAPVVIAAPAGSPQPSAPASLRTPGTVEIVVNDAIVRVSGQVDAGLIAAVLHAVRKAP